MRFTFLITSFALLFQPLFAADDIKNETSNPPLKELRALVIPKKEATLSSSILGRITKLDADIGDSIKKGQMLVSFDPGSYLAEYNKTKAELNEATKIHEATQKLVKNDAVSLLEVTRAEASLQKAKAELELKQHFLNECRILAPYDCRVTKKLSNAHEVVPAGAKLLSIVGDEPLRVQLLVPSQHFENLKLKNKFNVTLDETKQTYPVTISQIGAKIDPASQSVEVLADFEKYDPKIIVGMSGIATLQ